MRKVLKGRATVAKAAADPFLFGDQNIESTGDFNTAGSAEAYPFTNQTAGTAMSIHVYVDSPNYATTLIAGLYSDKGGHPGSRLASGSLSSPKAGTWNTVTVGSATVNTGGIYWVVVLGNGGTLFFRDRSGGLCNSEMSSQTNLGSLPSSWTSGSQWNTCPISAYVMGTLKTTGTPPPSNTALPQVSGATTQGHVLSTSNGSWSNSPTSYAYQWQDCDASGTNCASISGATSSGYMLASGDVGHTIRAKVTGTNAGGSASASSAQTASVAATLPSRPVNTALPQVTGTTTQGQALSTSNGSWSNSPTSYAYQWQDCDSSGANCASISGATSSGYMLASGDVGHTIRAVATATNAGGSASATSASTTPVSAALATTASFGYSPASPVTGQSVHFDGTGSTCAATPCSYTWADNPPSGGSWPLGSGQSMDFTFSGAGTKYATLTVTDGLNRTATVEHSVVVTSAAPPPPPPPPPAPANTGLPQVSGTTTQGQTLSTSNGSWSNSPTSYAYQWQDCDSSGANCTSTSGATSSSYTLASGDVGHTVRAVVTATNAGGSTAASSAQTAAIAANQTPAPSNTTLPQASGTPTEGDMLNTSNGSWTGTPTGYANKWQDCNSSGASCANISGATSSSYMLAGGDVGHTVRAVVTATNAGGSTAASSAQTASVASSGGGGACSTTFSPSSWSASAVESAGSGGQTLCLGSGSYSAIELISYHPSSTVTIQPASGASVSLGTITLAGVSNVTITGFQGSSSSGGLLTQGQYQGPVTNITFSYNSMSSNGVNISPNDVANANITIAHNRFVGFGSAGEQSRMLVNTQNSNACPNGVVITHNLMSGGESDGIDIDGGTCGTQILSNEITGIIESNCNGIHCDAIQDNGGGMNTTISGNWLHNNSDGLLFDDGDSGAVITNNVIDNPTYRVCEGNYQNAVFQHNTLNGECNVGQDHQADQSSNVVFENNIVTDISYYPGCTSAWGSWKTLDYNLHSSGAYNCYGNAAHDTISSPSYTGGSDPTTWAGWALAASSPGAGHASDATNMGAPISPATTPGP